MLHAQLVLDLNLYYATAFLLEDKVASVSTAMQHQTYMHDGATSFEAFGNWPMSGSVCTKF